MLWAVVGRPPGRTSNLRGMLGKHWSVRQKPRDTGRSKW